MIKSMLEKVIDDWQKNGGDLTIGLRDAGDMPIKRKADALAICRALGSTIFENEVLKRGENFSSLHLLISKFQEVESKEAFNVFRDKGLPHLRRLTQMAIATTDSNVDLLFFLLKILAMYRQPEDVRLIVKTATKPIKPDGYMWFVVFSQVTHEHPGWSLLCDALRDPLPKDFMAVAYLDFANKLALDGALKHHPFSSEEGMKKLKEWLNLGIDNYDYSLSATTALPFIDHPQRDELLKLASNHRHYSVQLEAAWAMAKVGHKEGKEKLIFWSLDPRHSKAACSYLRELGYNRDLPARTMEPEFEALAEIYSWLEHPNEYGRPPDEMELYDTRVLYWPPTKDKRRLWLYKYLYRPQEEGEETAKGFGMVGSITFSLFGEEKDIHSPEDAYALHCIFELEHGDYQSDPNDSDIVAGRKILAEYNEGF